MTKLVYLDRYAWKEILFPSYTPPKNLEFIIVIPSFREKDLVIALNSLNRCTPPNGEVLIIVLINEPESADGEIQHINTKCFTLLQNYNSKFELMYSYQKLPAKKAGVGLARKVGMDEAVRIFEKSGKDGIIICYDADCICEKDYLTEIERHFTEKKINGGVVFFEHQLNGKNHTAILNYELYLRYYIDALRYAGFPFAHQTLGSCIVTRSSVYQKQGGMNTRKAGEDFYFLGKVIPLGGFIEINSTTIYPSDRISDRVPFGTGKAVGQLLATEEAYCVYNPKTFEDLKIFFNKVKDFQHGGDTEIPLTLKKFLGDKWRDELITIKSQTASQATFSKRFFSWFDAFKVLKFVHFARDHCYENIPLVNALSWLERSYLGFLPKKMNEKLVALRALDRKGFI